MPAVRLFRFAILSPFDAIRRSGSVPSSPNRPEISSRAFRKSFRNPYKFPTEPPPPAARRSRLALLGAVLCGVGAVGAFVTGLLISGGVLHAGYGVAAFASSVKGLPAVSAGMVPGLLLLILGALLL